MRVGDGFCFFLFSLGFVYTSSILWDTLLAPINTFTLIRSNGISIVFKQMYVFFFKNACICLKDILSIEIDHKGGGRP